MQYCLPSLYRVVRNCTRSATEAETGSIFRDSHQLTHLFQQELYDFDVLVHQDEHMISAASPEMPSFDDNPQI